MHWWRWCRSRICIYIGGRRICFPIPCPFPPWPWPLPPIPPRPGPDPPPWLDIEGFDGIRPIANDLTVLAGIAELAKVAERPALRDALRELSTRAAEEIRAELSSQLESDVEVNIDFESELGSS